MTKARLHIESLGEGQDIVMLHGWGMNSAVFTPLHTALSEYRVHYVDLPGFGFSPPHQGTITDWVDLLVNALPDNAIWMGWSLGGLVATQAAIRFPERVKGLVTIASSPRFMAHDEQAWPGMPAQILSQFGNELEQNLARTIERFLVIQAMGSDTAKEDIKQLKELVLGRPLPDAAALRQGLDMLAAVDLRDELVNINQPWLRVWGRLDGLVPRRVPPKMPRHHADIEDVILAKASHAPFFSHPEDFLTELLRWLNKQVP